MRLLERRPRETARDFAIRVIRFNIVMTVLEPGCMVSENELAAEMGVSRTPVREALQELCKTGIVVIFPQHGSMVSKIDFDRVEEARCVRFALETTALRRVCELAQDVDVNDLDDNVSLQRLYLERSDIDKLVVMDNEFHRGLFCIAKMQITYDLLRDFSAHYERVRHLSMQVVKFGEVVADHQRILDAVRLSDTDQACQAMSEHLDRNRLDIGDIREKYRHFIVE